MKPPRSNVADREARRKRVEEFKALHGLGPVSEETKARCLAYVDHVRDHHVRIYHNGVVPGDKR